MNYLSFILIDFIMEAEYAHKILAITKNFVKKKDTAKLQKIIYIII